MEFTSLKENHSNQYFMYPLDSHDSLVSATFSNFLVHPVKQPIEALEEQLPISSDVSHVSELSANLPSWKGNLIPQVVSEYLPSMADIKQISSFGGRYDMMLLGYGVRLAALMAQEKESSQALQIILASGGGVVLGVGVAVFCVQRSFSQLSHLCWA